MTSPSTPAPSPRTTGQAVSAATLINLLEQQSALVGELAALAEGQAQLIARSETDDLLALLTRRQVLIDAFTGSQDEMHELSGALGKDLSAVPSDDRTRIEALIDDIGKRLAEVMDRDARDQQSLEAVRGRTRGELSALDSARTARNAYTHAGAGAAKNRFADKKG